MKVSDNWRPINSKKCLGAAFTPIRPHGRRPPHFRPNSDRTSRVSNYGVIAIDTKKNRRRVIAVGALCTAFDRMSGLARTRRAGLALARAASPWTFGRAADQTQRLASGQ